MNSIQLLSQQSELSEAAYANFIDPVTKSVLIDQTRIQRALEAEKFSTTQAADFVSQWRVIDQFTAPFTANIFGTGFSATLFQNIETNRYAFAVRGTNDFVADIVSADFGDIVVDGIAMDQLVDMYNYWQSLTTTGVYQAARLETMSVETAQLQLLNAGRLAGGQATYNIFVALLKSEGRILDTSPLGITTVRQIVTGDSDVLLGGTSLALGHNLFPAMTVPIQVVGHSLGGHLAAAFTRLFPLVPAQATTISGAGFPTGVTPGLGGNAISNIQNLFNGLGGATSFNPVAVANIHGSGQNFVTMNSQFGLVQQGSTNEIFIEDPFPSPAGTFGHSVSLVTDSLAIYSLFATLDSQLTNATLEVVNTALKPVFEAASVKVPSSHEALINALVKFFGLDFSPLAGTLIDDRDELYKRVVPLQTAIKGLTENSPLTLDILTTLTAADLANLAQGSSAYGYRYALKELNPFAILGNNDLYDPHNQNGELNLYTDESAAPAGMTSQYITDRAEMLAWKNLDYTYDGKRALRSKQLLTYDYIDKTFKDSNENDLTFRVKGTQDSAVTTPVKVVFGNNQDETLIGGDVYIGDHLYGGGGDDTLVGNGGDDYLEGGKDFDTYVYTNGDGQDTILDTDGQGKIVFDGVTLAGGERLASGAYISSDKRFRYELQGDIATGGTLVINGDIRVENFRNGDLDIRLSDASALPGVQPFSQIIVGDENNPRILFGGLDNDYINVTGLNGPAIGEAGNDLLVQETLEPGIDGGMLHGNSGDDVIVWKAEGSLDAVGGAGQDIILGGEGPDFILGDMAFAFIDENAGQIIVDDFSFADGFGNYYFDFGASDSLYPFGFVGGFEDALNFALGITTDAGISTLYDDFVDGGDGDDLLAGGFGSDLLLGGAGDDSIVGDVTGPFSARPGPRSGIYANLFGAPGDDFLDGGGGNDKLLDRDGGSDTFVGGNGDDTVTNVDPLNGAITYKNSLEGGDGRDFLISDNRSVDGFDTLLGGAGSDALSSVYGDVLLDGGTGNDTYAISRGHVGQITIQDHDSSPGNVDRLVFGTLNRVSSDAPEGTTGNLDANWNLVNGILPSQVSITRDQSSLYLSVDGIQDKVTLLNWFVSDDDKIEEVHFEDGTVWDVAALTAMATSADPDNGTADNDVLVGIDGITNRLSGDAGDDTLIGGNIDDVLNGGAGKDTLAGGGGDDAYLFSLGDGVDHIVDSEGSNTIQFGPGITPDMLTLGLGSLLIQVGGSGDAIHLDDFNSNDVFNVPSVDNFQFDDGTSLTYANLVARGFQILGTGGNDFLTGTDVDDRFDGGAGNDTLGGNTGNDTYLFGLGSGQDRIEDFDVTPANADILRIGAGVGPDDLEISRNNSDLLVSINGAHDQVVITNWFEGFANKIERVTFADGTEWDATTLEGRAIVPNTPPSVANAIPNQTANEDFAFNYIVVADSFFDPDVGDMLVFSATMPDGSALPAWLTFDAATRTFSGIPLSADVGALSVKVTATDAGGLSAFDIFDVAVAHTNHAPVALPGIIAVGENATTANLAPALLANDIDIDQGDTRSIAGIDITGTIGTVSFDAVTQTLTYAANAASQDSLAAGVTALDQFIYTIVDGVGATSTAAVTVTVTGVNDVPTLAHGIGDQAAAQGVAYNFGVPVNTFVDVDVGDTLTYSATLANGAALPNWLRFSSTNNTFGGTPQNGDVGIYNLKITAADSGGFSVSNTLRLTVANVNDAPRLENPIEDQSVLQDQLLLYQVAANAFTDIDAAYGDSLVFEATLANETALPSWLRFDPVTRNLNGTPHNGDVGSYSVKLTATDNDGLSVSNTFELNVANLNDAPMLEIPLADQVLLQDQALHYRLPANTFTDIDVSHGDTLTLTAALANGADLPGWLNFDPTSQTLGGIPGNGDVGKYSVTLTATDGGNLSVSDTFDLTILGVNEPGTFAGAYNALASAGETGATIRQTEPSDVLNDSSASGAADTATSTDESSAVPQTADDSMQQEIQARIDTWFDEVGYRQPMELSDFDQVRDSTIPALPDEPKSVDYIMAQWAGIETNLSPHLAKYADSGLDLATENLFSNAFAIPSVNAAPVVDVVGLSPASGLDLKPLKGINEGLSKLEFA